MKSRSASVTLQGWLLTGLLPGLGIFVLIQATLLYVHLREVVVGGFDNELAGISTTVAGFIEPADYERLVGAPPFGGLAADPGGDLWAVDRSDYHLWRISPVTGAAVDTGIVAPAGTGTITSAGHPRRFVLADDQTGIASFFNADAGSFASGFTLEPPVSGFAVVPGQSELFTAGRFLHRVSAETGTILSAFPLALHLRSLAWDSRRGALWGLDATGERLISINPRTGSEHVRSRLHRVVAGTNTPVALETIAYDDARGTLFGTDASLERIDPVKGIVSSTGFVAGFGREQSALYRRYADPMRRIRRRANLAYLYTQQVEGRDRIHYGLDVSDGTQHSTLLSADTVREADVNGLQRLLTVGSIYVSGIERWPVWGLLKSAYAPIFDDRGHVQSMVGADIRAHQIQTEIRRALLLTFIFVLAMLFLTGLVSLAVARRVSASLVALRRAALTVGAGDFSPQINVRRPKDLRQLADRFTAAAGRLRRELDEMKANLSVHQEARDRDRLAERLAAFPALAAPPADAGWAWGEIGPKPAGTETASGAVLIAQGALAWLARAGADPLRATERKAEIAAVVEALAKRHGDDLDGLAAALNPLFSSHVEAWALLTAAGIGAAARQPGLFVRVGADGTRTEVTGASLTKPLRPEPGEALILSTPNAPFDALPDPSLVPAASGLFAAWRAVAPPEGTRAFAVLVVGGES